jgi:hypothetical protein
MTYYVWHNGWSYSSPTGSARDFVVGIIALIYGAPTIIGGIALGYYAQDAWHWHPLFCILLGMAPVVLVCWLMVISRIFRFTLLFLETLAFSAVTFLVVALQPGWDDIWAGGAALVMLVAGLLITRAASRRAIPTWHLSKVAPILKRNW